MYVTVLEALDLKQGMSFLNVGSGSGYLSALASLLLGEGGLSHGIEVSESMVQHSIEAVKQWHEKNNAVGKGHDPANKFPVTLDSIKFVNGNCFDIDLANTVSTCRYDRIYVGAGCPEARKEFFLSMLNEDGVLVVPINEKNQMIRVRRFCGSVFNQTHVSNVHFAPLVGTSVRPDEADHIQQAHLIQLREQRSRSSSLVTDPRQDHAGGGSSSSSFFLSDQQLGDEYENGSYLAYGVLSADTPSFFIHPSPSLPVRKLPTAGTSSGTAKRVCLPPLIWAPNRNRHLQFPKEFRRALFAVLMINNRIGCSCRGAIALGPQISLPHQMWLYIFTFMNRYDCA